MIHAALAFLALSIPPPVERLPFGPGERISLRITWARLLAGRSVLGVDQAPQEGPPRLQFVLTTKSEGFFAWLMRYRVDDHIVAVWDPTRGCSLRIDKRLREGKLVRDQSVRFDPATGRTEVQDTRLRGTSFEAGRCPLDVLSAFYVARARGLGPDGTLSVRIFDNGKSYQLRFRVLRKERLNLPPPLGRGVMTQVVEPQVPRGAFLFAQEGPLTLWVTDDARRIPVRMRTKVAVGSVSADLESYVPPAEYPPWNPAGGLTPPR